MAQEDDYTTYAYYGLGAVAVFGVGYLLYSRGKQAGQQQQSESLADHARRVAAQALQTGQLPQGLVGQNPGHHGMGNYVQAEQTPQAFGSNTLVPFPSESAQRTQQSRVMQPGHGAQSHPMIQAPQNTGGTTPGAAPGFAPGTPPLGFQGLDNTSESF